MEKTIIKFDNNEIDSLVIKFGNNKNFTNIRELFQ